MKVKIHINFYNNLFDKSKIIVPIANTTHHDANTSVNVTNKTRFYNKIIDNDIKVKNHDLKNSCPQ